MSFPSKLRIQMGATQLKSFFFNTLVPNVQKEMKNSDAISWCFFIYLFNFFLTKYLLILWHFHITPDRMFWQKYCFPALRNLILKKISFLQFQSCCSQSSWIVWPKTALRIGGRRNFGFRQIISAVVAYLLNTSWNTSWSFKVTKNC